MFKFSFLAALVFIMPLLAQLTSEQEQAFYKQLRDEIMVSQKKFMQLKDAMEGGKKAVTPKEQEALANAATATEVKYILYRNFYDTPSIQVPIIRQKLLQLFKKEFISMDDLSDLKVIVDKEKDGSVSQ